MPTGYDLTVDFMGMTNEMRPWVRPADVRTGFEPTVGRHAIVGDGDPDQRAARIVAVDGEVSLELVVVPGTVDARTHLLAQA